MKAYPTVNDLPDDVRARFRGDALEVYRAAYNISHAYGGHDREHAAQEADRAARSRARHPQTTGIGVVLYVVGVAALLWTQAGLSTDAFLPSFVRGVILATALFGFPWLRAMWHFRQDWLQREAELLGADGNPTMPGASPPVSPITSPRKPRRGGS